MEIELRLMRYAVAVADAGGFQSAAERLHMSQPPLSRQIRDLERRLGVELFVRRPLKLTPAGEAFVRRSRMVLARADRLAEETRLAAVGKTGTVLLSYVLSAAYDTVPSLLEEVARRHPHIAVEAREDWSTALAEALARGDLDLVVAHTLPVRATFGHKLLRREALVAVVSASHRFAEHSNIRLRYLSGDAFAFYDRRHAPARYDLLHAALDASDERFEHREDMLPGLRSLRLPDAESFTLVPSSMAGGLPGGVAALPLLDEGPPPDRHGDCMECCRVGTGGAPRARCGVRPGRPQRMEVNRRDSAAHVHGMGEVERAKAPQ